MRNPYYEPAPQVEKSTYEHQGALDRVAAYLRDAKHVEEIEEHKLRRLHPSFRTDKVFRDVLARITEGRKRLTTGDRTDG